MKEDKEDKHLHLIKKSSMKSENCDPLAKMVVINMFSLVCNQQKIVFIVFHLTPDEPFIST